MLQKSEYYNSRRVKITEAILRFTEVGGVSAFLRLPT